MTCLIYRNAWIEAHRDLGHDFVTMPLVDIERLVRLATTLDRRVRYAETELRRLEREAGWRA
jgi:hypothetical protein